MTAPAPPPGYTHYPHRGYGMDHSWYAWPPPHYRVAWPGGQSTALCIVIALEWFPLDMGGSPVRVPGALQRPYPDFGMYSLRDYGNRIGIFRVMDVLDELGLVASVAMNAAVAERYPVLVEEVEGRGWELVAHGVDMGTPHHGGLDVDTERQQIRTALAALAERASGAVSGWLSPGRSESMHTLALLAEQGLSYVCDWPNDGLPYRLRTDQGPLTALPLSNELDDYTILVELRHSEPSFARQVNDAYQRLQQEADHAGGGRLLTLSVRPWIIGQPHRIDALRSGLVEVVAGGVWSATGADVVAACEPHWPD